MAICFVFATALAGCSDFFGSGGLESLAEKVSRDVVTKDPLLWQINAPGLPDNAPADIETWHRNALAHQNALAGIDTSELNAEQRLQFDQLEIYLGTVVERDSLLFHPYLISHLYGIHLIAPSFFEQFSINSEKEVDGYASELMSLEAKFGGLIDGLENQRKRGIVPPSFILRKTISQCDSMAEMQVEQCVFMTALQDKIAGAGISNSKHVQASLEKCRQQVSKSVIPSYKRLAAYLRQLEHASVSVAGVWQLPKGDDFYLYLLKFRTGFIGDPNELHDIGKIELQAIEGEMEILRPFITRMDSNYSFLEKRYDSEQHILSVCNEAYRLFDDQDKFSQEASISPAKKLEFLNAHQFATAMMLTDIGIHQKQWLREQAVLFLSKHSILSSEDAEVYVDRIIVYPALESAAKIGYLKLQEMKQDADMEVRKEKDGTLQRLPIQVLERRLEQNRKLPS